MTSRCKLPTSWCSRRFRHAAEARRPSRKPPMPDGRLPHRSGSHARATPAGPMDRARAQTPAARTTSSARRRGQGSSARATAYPTPTAAEPERRARASWTATFRRTSASSCARTHGRLVRHTMKNVDVEHLLVRHVVHRVPHERRCRNRGVSRGCHPARTLVFGTNADPTPLSCSDGSGPPNTCVRAQLFAPDRRETQLSRR